MTNKNLSVVRFYKENDGCLFLGASLIIVGIAVFLNSQLHSLHNSMDDRNAQIAGLASIFLGLSVLTVPLILFLLSKIYPERNVLNYVIDSYYDGVVFVMHIPISACGMYVYHLTNSLVLGLVLNLMMTFLMLLILFWSYEKTK